MVKMVLMYKDILVLLWMQNFDSYIDGGDGKMIVQMGIRGLSDNHKISEGV